MRGEGGQKIRKFCGHHIRKLPQVNNSWIANPLSNKVRGPNQVAADSEGNGGDDISVKGILEI